MGVRDSARAVYRVEPESACVREDEVPRGYKCTEVGVIPEGWEVRVVDAVLDEISMGPFGSDITVSNFISEGIPVLNGANVAGEKLVDSFENFVTPEKARSLKKAVARRGDVVVTHRGTIGQVSYIPEGSGFDRYVISQSQFRARFASSAAIPAWVVRYFHTEHGARALLEKKGHTGVPAIAQPTSTFRRLCIPLPPVKEQRAIDDALSDADALIESLQQLIAKQRAIKQGAMQALLTGRQHLPGFAGEWQTKRLDGLADVRSGGTPSTSQPQFWDGEILWCTPTDITALDSRKYLNSTARRITRKGLDASSAEMIPAWSIIMTSRATIGECAINVVALATNQGFKNFVPFAEMDTEFLYYLLSTQSDRFKGLCGGSTFLEIGKAQLSAYEVELPETKEEQTAIAIVLSDMDAEIEALEARLAKTRALKAGMMQALLTGRIRLV